MMSVSVSDHIPSVEYSTTNPPPSRIDALNDRPNITCITLPMAMIEVTATIRSYASMIAPLVTRAAG